MPKSPAVIRGRIAKLKDEWDKLDNFQIYQDVSVGKDLLRRLWEQLEWVLE